MNESLLSAGQPWKTNYSQRLYRYTDAILRPTTRPVRVKTGQKPQERLLLANIIIIIIASSAPDEFSILSDNLANGFLRVPPTSTYCVTDGYGGYRILRDLRKTRIHQRGNFREYCYLAFILHESATPHVYERKILFLDSE